MCSSRNMRGSELAEFAPALFLVWVLFFFPLMCFGTLGLRYGLLLDIARLASCAGAQCKTFHANPPGSELSASNLAKAIVSQAGTKYGGISVNRVDTFIVVTPFSGGTVKRQQSPLTNAAIATSNGYSFEVVVHASLQPLVHAGRGSFVNIPGLNVPLPVAARYGCMFESVQGLTL